MDSFQNIAAWLLAEEMIRDRYNPYGSDSCASSTSGSDLVWNENEANVSSEFSSNESNEMGNAGYLSNISDEHSACSREISKDNNVEDFRVPNMVENAAGLSTENDYNGEGHSVSSRSSPVSLTDESTEENDKDDDDPVSTDEYDFDESDDHDDMSESDGDEKENANNIHGRENDSEEIQNQTKPPITGKPGTCRMISALPPQFPFKFVIADSRGGSRIGPNGRIKGKKRNPKNKKHKQQPENVPISQRIQHLQKPATVLGDRKNFPELQAVQREQEENQKPEPCTEHPNRKHDCIIDNQTLQHLADPALPVEAYPYRLFLPFFDQCQQFNAFAIESVAEDPLQCYEGGWSALVEDFEDDIAFLNAQLEKPHYQDFNQVDDYINNQLHGAEVFQAPEQCQYLDPSIFPPANPFVPGIPYIDPLAKEMPNTSPYPEMANNSSFFDTSWQAREPADLNSSIFSNTKEVPVPEHTGNVLQNWQSKEAPQTLNSSNAVSPNIINTDILTGANRSSCNNIGLSTPKTNNIPSYAQALKSSWQPQTENIVLEEQFPSLVSDTCNGSTKEVNISLRDVAPEVSSMVCDDLEKTANNTDRSAYVDQCDDDYDMYLDQFVYENLDQAGTYDMDTARSFYDNEWNDSCPEQYTVTLGPEGNNISMDITEMEKGCQGTEFKGCSSVSIQRACRAGDNWRIANTSENTNEKSDFTANPESCQPSPGKNQAKFVYKGTHFFVPYTPKNKKNQIVDPNIPRPKFFPVPKHRRGRRKRSPPRGFTMGLAGTLSPIHYLRFAPPSNEHGHNNPDLTVAGCGVIYARLRYGVCAEITLDHHIRVTNLKKNTSLFVNDTGSLSFLYHSAGRVLHDNCTTEIHVYHNRKVKVADEIITLANESNCFTFTGEDAQQSKYVSFTKDNGDVSSRLLYGTVDAPIDRSNDREKCKEKLNEAKMDYLEFGAYTVEIHGLRLNQNARGDVTMAHGKTFMYMSPSTGSVVLQTPELGASVAPNWAMQIHTTGCRMSATRDGLVVTNGHIEVGFDKDGFAFGFQLPDRHPLMFT